MECIKEEGGEGSEKEGEDHTPNYSDEEFEQDNS